LDDRNASMALTTPPTDGMTWHGGVTAAGLLANRTGPQLLQASWPDRRQLDQCDRDHRTSNGDVTHRNGSTQRNGAIPREFSGLPAGGWPSAENHEVAVHQLLAGRRLFDRADDGSTVWPSTRLRATSCSRWPPPRATGSEYAGAFLANEPVQQCFNPALARTVAIRPELSCRPPDGC
jgi:hypothetical protein